MSVSFGCHCAERRRPVEERAWGVIQRRCRCSAFDGYRVMPSDYSCVICLVCGAMGRTKAKFVDDLPKVGLVNGRWGFDPPRPSRLAGKILHGRIW